MEGEPGRWYQRFERFRLFGPDRTVQATFNEWRLSKSRELSRSTPKTWRDAAARWGWRERAEAWDAHLAKQAGEAAERERLRILSSGFALRHRRVEELDKLATLLLGELNDVERRWLRDIKGIGSGRDGTFREVEIERFNAAIIEQFRDTLADLAEEMGERSKSLDLTSKGEKIVVTLKAPDDD